MNAESPISEQSTLLTNFLLQKAACHQLKSEPILRRKERLKKLQSWILANRSAIQEAMYADFRKNPLEVDAIELVAVLSEIRNALRNLNVWTAPKKVSTPLIMAGTSSYVQCEPRGLCLIIAPWNYPFLLCAGPLVWALAAGNSVVLKPSELTPHVSAVISRMTREVFEPTVVSCYEGGPEMSQQLLALPFDHIFFTGSPTVGKIVMKAAAENLTSVTLELGGKSPAIIAQDARLDEAAERIAVTKFVNNGQTCIAPDYVLVEESIADSFVSKLVEKTEELFKEDGKSFDQSSYYCRIVNDNHFNRLENLLTQAKADGAKVRLGGASDGGSRFIAPTILTQVPLKSRLMREEIFGPILPVITFRDLIESIAIINDQPKPLALYIFSESKRTQEQILGETSSGGACINDCGIHFFQYNLPFGGVNNSGIGKSHGYHGFLDFSNQKSVLKQRGGFTSVKLLYPPYTHRSSKIIGWLFRFLTKF